MMEPKVWFALCALLLMNVGPAEQSPTSAAAVTSAADHVSASSMNSTSHPAPGLNDSNSNVTSKMNAVLETSSLTPEAKNNNDTTSSASVTSLGNNATIPYILPATSLPHKADNTSKDTTNTTAPSHERSTANTATTTPTATRNQSSSPPSNSSAPELSKNETQTLTTPRASETERTHGQPQSAISPNTEAKAHVDSPTQLNVGGEKKWSQSLPNQTPSWLAWCQPSSSLLSSLLCSSSSNCVEETTDQNSAGCRIYLWMIWKTHPYPCTPTDEGITEIFLLGKYSPSVRAHATAVDKPFFSSGTFTKYKMSWVGASKFLDCFHLSRSLTCR
ncbi:hypothetical protein Q5P01_016270 [Channa striata]|uniref:Uncharacterized protein n=1 Tax=Channa striata TaxID=64152 RepID=A0AA88MHG5_CHASR|nr:hypothetical protein Q5P01_016270 [Channa striata]